MTKSNGRQLQFHPFFRVKLVQMIRHDEIQAAARLAVQEAMQTILALRKRAPSGDDTGGASRALQVPTQERMALFKRPDEQVTEVQRTKAKEQSYGWER